MRSPVRRARAASALVLAAAFLSLGFPATAFAAPIFKLPFPCGQVWGAATYDGHYSGPGGPNSYPIDFNRADDLHDPVVASQAGWVSRVDLTQGVVELYHGGGWETTYGHMSAIPAYFTAGSATDPDDGTFVARGQVVGRVDQVSASSPHLHYAQMLNDVPQPPAFDGSAVTISKNYSAPTWLTSTNCGTGSADDFNGDGNADLLAISDADGRLRLFAGRGDGTLNNGVQVGGAGWAAHNDIAVGDYNSDGKGDLLTINDGDGRLRLYTGNGDGTINAGVQVGGAGWAPYNAITSGDYNGDGKADLLGISDTDGRLRLFTGNGNGTLNTATQVGGAGWAPYDAIAAGDYNSDGKTDLMALNPSEGRLRLFTGNGNATLNTPITYGPGWGAVKAIAGADYNGDGHADLLALNGVDGKLRLYLGNGAGGLADGIVVGSGWTSYDAIGS